MTSTSPGHINSHTGALVAGSILGGLLLAPPDARALVKGNAPPANLRSKATAGGKPKAANVDDALELGRQKVMVNVDASQVLVCELS